MSKRHLTGVSVKCADNGGEGLLVLLELCVRVLPAPWVSPLSGTCTCHMSLSGHSPKVKEVLSDKQALTVEQWQSDGAGAYSPTHTKAVSSFKKVFLTELRSGAETPIYVVYNPKE